MTPQHYWVPLAMALIRPRMWRVAPRGLTVTPEHDHDGGLGDDDDHDDDKYHKIYKAISDHEGYFKNHAQLGYFIML